MGNSLRGQQQDWRHLLSPLPIDPSYDYLTHWKNANGDLYLARQIQLPEYLGLQVLKKRLQKREAYHGFSSSFIYPLGQCYFERISSLCSQQEHCLLTCSKPNINLQKSMQDRKMAARGFTIEQINLILNNIGLGLKTINELGEPFCPLRMAHIVVKDNIYLMDPILVQNDPFGYGAAGQYPAPEQIIEHSQTQNIREIPKEFKLPMQLFSLGLIGLQLYHTSIKVKDIYIRYHKYGSIIGVNMQKLNELIQQIGDHHLRAKIATLTNPNPHSRSIFYNFICNENYHPSKAQAIAKQIQNSNKPALNPPSPLYAKDNKKTPVLKEAKQIQNMMLSPSHNHLHRQQQNPKENINNYNNKPKVSINFVSKIHNNSNVVQTNMVIPRKNITFSHISQHQPANRIIKTRNNENLSQTPIRIKKKHNFSTIKEVSQDECASTSRLKTFQDVSINGRYEGDLKSGKRHGKGTFYFQQGSIYQGQWKDDQMHGFGKLYYPTGKLAYEGQWKNNQFSGQGKVYNYQPKQLKQPFDFTDFNNLNEEWISYQGILIQDQRQGLGCLMLSNGEQFRGSFSQDKIHGPGEFVTLQGKVIRGVWSDCILQRTFNQ